MTVELLYLCCNFNQHGYFSLTRHYCVWTEIVITVKLPTWFWYQHALFVIFKYARRQYFYDFHTCSKWTLTSAAPDLTSLFKFITSIPNGRLPLLFSQMWKDYLHQGPTCSQGQNHPHVLGKQFYNMTDIIWVSFKCNTYEIRLTRLVTSLVHLLNGS